MEFFRAKADSFRVRNFFQTRGTLMSRRIHRDAPAELRALARRGLLCFVTASTAATICLLPVDTAAAQPIAALAAVPAAVATSVTAAPTDAGAGTTGQNPAAPTSADPVVTPPPAPAPAPPPASAPSTAAPTPAPTVEAVPPTAAAQAPDTAAPATNVASAPDDPNPDTGTTDPSPSFSLSSAARAFLSTLQLNAGSGPVTGTLNGSVLTVDAGAPKIPFQLPSGAPSVTFTTATLTIDESTRTLSLTAGVAAGNGLGGTLTVTIAHADTTDLTGADLTATLNITGIPALGTTVDVSGSLTYVGGKLGASLTGTLGGDAV